MFLPNYEVIIRDSKEEAIRTIQFDKISVYIYGDAKYSSTIISYSLNSEYIDQVNLSMYIKAVNDYLISNPTYKKHKKKMVNVFDFNCIKTVFFENLSINSDEFQIINNSYPNLTGVYTLGCNISKEAMIGCLKCNYTDQASNIMSLDSFNGFSGRVIRLQDTKIEHMNKNMLNLLCEILLIENVDIDYELFFLTTNAPKMRKLEIDRDGEKLLTHQDLLFISGFYNLEYIAIDAIIESYKEINKLERLRVLEKVFISDPNELNIVKEKRKEFYSMMKAQGASNEILLNYLKRQKLYIQEKYLDFLHKLYVDRLDRVKWENKISTKSLEEIKKELIYIYNLQNSVRKNISREKSEYSVLDYVYELAFDDILSRKDEEFVLTESRPCLFDDDDLDGGIKYYVRNKRIIVDK